MRCHYEGTGYLEGRCIGTKGIDPCIGYERCATFKLYKMTNAERIRAMSDEELGIFLAEWAEKPWAWKQDGEGECLVWLREPVKDGGNE